MPCPQLLEGPDSATHPSCSPKQAREQRRCSALEGRCMERGTTRSIRFSFCNQTQHLRCLSLGVCSFIQITKGSEGKELQQSWPSGCTGGVSGAGNVGLVTEETVWVTWSYRDATVSAHASPALPALAQGRRPFMPDALLFLIKLAVGKYNIFLQ